MTVNAIERENVRLATDNRRLRIENAHLIQTLHEIESDTINTIGGPIPTLSIIYSKIQETFRKLPGIGE